MGLQRIFHSLRKGLKKPWGFEDAEVEGLGAHTRTIQERHLVRGLLSETSTKLKVKGLGLIRSKVESFL